ncbi:MAG: PEP-CTERM sorting domain-containing protein [Cyanobacteriota bacterium]
MGSTAKVVVVLGASAVGLAATALPSNALQIFTDFDPNGDASVNLLTTTGIPNSSAAETAFLTQLVGTGTETFESFANGTSGPLAIMFPGAGTATLSGSGVINSVPAGQTNGSGRYGVSPTNYWEVVAGSSGSFNINFSDPIAAFGFYGIDIGDFQGTLSLVFDNGNIATQAIPTAPINQADGSVLYWGIITDPSEGDISSISFQTTIGSGDVFAFDNFTIGSREQVADVPGPLPLLGAGAAFGWSRRLRRRVKASVA